MRDSQGGGELDPAEDVRRRCMENSPSFLSCICKRTKEGCDRGSEVETVHSGYDGKGSVPPRKPKESGRRGSLWERVRLWLPSPHFLTSYFHGQADTFVQNILHIWRGFWWHRTLVRLWESDSSLLIWVVLIKVVEDSNVFV